MKKTMSLDDAARRYAGGHYVKQSMPGANPERDKMVSDAIAVHPGRAGRYEYEYIRRVHCRC